MNAEILLIGLGLSMDAFAVSVTNGLSGNAERKRLLTAAVCFGSFQGLMPLLGFAVGRMFAPYIAAFDHWIALLLLGFIGGKMCLDGLHPTEQTCNSLTLQTILLQSIAVSIDAMAVGVSFAALPDVQILPAAAVITAETAVISRIGSLLGRYAGMHLGSRAQFMGGLLLIGIGCKIFAEHVFFQ